MRILTAISVEYESDEEIDRASDVCNRLQDDFRNLLKRAAPRGSTTDTFISCGRAYESNRPQVAEDMIRAINSSQKESPKTSHQGNKVLIACMTCHELDYKFKDGLTVLSDVSRPIGGRRQAIRDTWWKDIPDTVDKRFFFGKGGVNPSADEVFLDVPDNYENLAYKVRAICRWALDNGYEYLFKCDDDTFVYVDHLLTSDYRYHHYIGQDLGGYASGLGYWLDKEAMAAVAAMSLAPKEYAEDYNVGKAVKAAGFQLHNDTRYFHDPKNPLIDPKSLDTSNHIAIHCCPPEVMKTLYGSH